MVGAVTFDNPVRRVPLKDQTAAYKIFHRYFECAVPQMYLYTEGHLKTFGQVICSDEAYNARAPLQMIDCRMTIMQLSELLEEGATIRVNDPEDARVIYDIIFDHLSDWSKAVGGANAFSMKTAPTDELMALSQLADTLYGHAQRTLKRQPPHGSLFRRFQSLARGQGLARQRVVPKTDEKGKRERPKLQHHASLTESILENGGGGQRWS